MGNTISNTLLYNLYASSIVTTNKCKSSNEESTEVTDRFALVVADEFFELFEGGKPPVSVILPRDSAQ